MKHLILLLLMLTRFNTILSMSSYPFVSGDTFRTFADHIFDERHRDFEPQDVNDGDVIFVKTDYIQEFFIRYHPRIPHRYILLTHNSDHSIPGTCAAYLDDPKLIVWFGQNKEYNTHPKLKAIPIGIANRYWPHGNITIVADASSKALLVKNKDTQAHLLYMNLALQTNQIRRKVFELFNNKEFCFTTAHQPFDKYLRELSQFCFVVSPEGNGIDCHRTWEALLVGCIPIVKSHSLNELYEGLPVLIVDTWEQITREFLEDAYKKIQEKKHTLEKLFADYWFSEINKYRN